MKKANYSIVFSFVFAIMVVQVIADSGHETKRIQYSIDVLNSVVAIPDKTIPRFFLKNAFGIAIIPGVLKGAFGLGGRWGLGVVTVRGDSGWSDPCFISVTGGSAGLQFGAQSSDFVLVFRTRQGVENMKKGKFTIGADVSATAGPVGRSAEASTDIEMKAEIYSYARSRGLFIGASLEGTSLRIDNQSNARFYKKNIAAEDIFTNKVENPPPIVNEFLQTISKITSAQPLTSIDSTDTD